MLSQIYYSALPAGKLLLTMPSATESTASVRIPAWKRLGLKLKSASEAPLADVTPKRKRPGEAGKDTSVKKSKPSSDSPGLSVPDQITPPPARKKSVTFTPETKVEDGDSIKQLFSVWVAEQKNQEDLSAPVFQTPQYQSVEESFDTTLDEKERRVKRVKTVKQGKADSSDPPKTKESTKAKKKKETNQPATRVTAEGEQAEESLKSTKQSKTKKARKPRAAKSLTTQTLPEKPFLAYLKQYTDSRDTWKFNKNHQTHLLKHLFNIDIVPSDYAHYIYEYVKGLQGGVRTRLRDSALAVKVKDLEEPFPEDMENSEQRKMDYDVAMKEYVATMMSAEVGPNVRYEEGVLLGLSDLAMPTRVAKRKRVERVLAELASGGGETNGGSTGEKDTVMGDDESQKRLRMNDGSSQKVIRKRKQRTAIVDDETSSEEDSSDSDDSSSDESTTQRDNPEDTSSSSSSSSSSSGSEDSGSEGDSEESESDSE
jgi:hypothetical protein